MCAVSLTGSACALHDSETSELATSAEREREARSSTTSAADSAEANAAPAGTGRDTRSVAQADPSALSDDSGHNEIDESNGAPGADDAVSDAPADEQRDMSDADAGPSFASEPKEDPNREPSESDPVRGAQETTATGAETTRSGVDEAAGGHQSAAPSRDPSAAGSSVVGAGSIGGDDPAHLPANGEESVPTQDPDPVTDETDEVVEPTAPETGQPTPRTCGSVDTPAPSGSEPDANSPGTSVEGPTDNSPSIVLVEGPIPRYDTANSFDGIVYDTYCDHDPFEQYPCVDDTSGSDADVVSGSGGLDSSTPQLDGRGSGTSGRPSPPIEPGAEPAEPCNTADHEPSECVELGREFAESRSGSQIVCAIASADGGEREPSLIFIDEHGAPILVLGSGDDRQTVNLDLYDMTYEQALGLLGGDTVYNYDSTDDAPPFSAELYESPTDYAAGAVVQHAPAADAANSAPPGLVGLAQDDTGVDHSSGSLLDGDPSTSAPPFQFFENDTPDSAPDLRLGDDASNAGLLSGGLQGPLLVFDDP